MKRTFCLKVLKNLVKYGWNCVDYQNNDVGHSNWLLKCQNFLQHCSLCLKVLHNYFDAQTKLFLGCEMFSISAKSFSSCRITNPSNKT